MSPIFVVDADETNSDLVFAGIETFVSTLTTDVWLFYCFGVTSDIMFVELVVEICKNNTGVGGMQRNNLLFHWEESIVSTVHECGP